MKRLALALAAAAVSTASSAAFAAPDGVAESAYGPALAVQSVQTQFGNSNLGNPLTANGSELDQAYGRIEGGVLKIILTGNLETNFNKLELFFDTGAGGQNQLRGDNADVDFNGLNRMGNDGSGNGLKFDAGFDADFYMTITGGNTGSAIQYFSNFATLPTSGGGSGTFVGGSANDSSLISGALGINIAVDNSNTGGVGGGTAADSGAGVLTGVEIEIPLAALGNALGDIRIVAFINGGGHDFLSNQVLGGLPGDFGNLGEPRTVDFSQIAGNQFFTVGSGVIPEPAALSLLGVPALLMLRRRV